MPKNYKMKAEPGHVGGSLSEDKDVIPAWRIPRDLIISLKPTCALCSTQFGGCAIKGEGVLMDYLRSVSGTVTCSVEEKDHG